MQQQSLRQIAYVGVPEPAKSVRFHFLAPIKRRATHISTRVSSIFLLNSVQIGKYSGLYVNCVCVCVYVYFVLCESCILEPVARSPFAAAATKVCHQSQSTVLEGAVKSIIIPEADKFAAAVAEMVFEKDSPYFYLTLGGVSLIVTFLIPLVIPVFKTFKCPCQ